MTRFVKLFSLFALMFVCVMAVMALTNKTVKADTEPNKAVSALMASYVGTNKQYTKLTQLETENIKGSYHANANTAKRRTYYDEGVDALLMGDYDGGFTYINSGYAKQDAETNNMQHYRNKAETKTTENLFVAEARQVDYTVYVTTPNKYFDNLSELAKTAKEASGWTVNNGVYTYKAEEALSGTASAPSDMLLKMFQYFSAPMVLVSEANHLQYVNVYETTYATGPSTHEKMLVIRLYDYDYNTLSTAYVVDGLVMQSSIVPNENAVTFKINYGTPKGKGLYVAGDFTNWGNEGHTVSNYRLTHIGFNNWVGSFKFTIGQTLNYKFIVDDYDEMTSTWTWEEDPNRMWTITEDDNIRISMWHTSPEIWSVHGSNDDWATKFDLRMAQYYGYWSIDVNLSAGTLKFKVHKDWDWSESYPYSDYEYSVTESGMYEIRFVSSTHGITIIKK